MTAQSDYLLNEVEFSKLVDGKKAIYVYNWLRSLSKLLLRTQKVMLNWYCFICCNFACF